MRHAHIYSQINTYRLWTFKNTLIKTSVVKNDL